MFSLSVRPWKMRDDNPAEGFLRRAETERERFLSLEEVDRLADAFIVAEDQRDRGRDHSDRRRASG